MVFFRRKYLPSYYQHLNVYLDSVKLTLSEHAQFLGTTVKSTLNWEIHCKNIANKLSRNNGMINRVKHLLSICYPEAALLLIYTAPYNLCSSTMGKQQFPK